MEKILYKAIALTLIFGAILLTSCTEDEESGIAQVGVKMEAVTNSNIISTSGRVESTLTFTKVLVGVTELELETLEEDRAEDEAKESKTEVESDGTKVEVEEDEGEIEFEGQFIVDLINGTSSPDFGLTEIPAGIYEELEIEMEPILEGGYTIYVAFDYTPEGGTDPVSVVFTYDGELEFELESEAGFKLDGTGINQLLVVFDLDVLLQGLDLSNAQAGEDGVVYVNSQSNKEIYLSVKSNLSQILEAGEDDDDDGKFDDDDDDDDD